MLTEGIILLHDNNLLQAANRTRDLIESFDWKQLSHTPYSPDLAPSDYRVLMHLEKHLGGQRHDDDDSVKTDMFQWLLNQAADFYDDVSLRREISRHS